MSQGSFMGHISILSQREKTMNVKEADQIIPGAAAALSEPSAQLA